MNDLQRTQWNILRELLRVCDILGLRCFLVCGSALGAVKYEGFIPWDDDVDAALYREDYEIFCSRAPALLPENLFLQNYRTDSRFPAIYSKLRHSETTYIEPAVSRLPIHHGVYIDVFPLDGYPESKIMQRWLEMRKRIYKHQLAAAFDIDRSGPAELIYRLNHALGMDRRAQSVARRYTAMIAGYPIRKGGLVCNHGNWQGTRDYAPEDWYGSGACAVFEGLHVCVPARYDAYLTRKYGDWRGDLPPEQQRGHHDYLICDLSRPYTAYTQKKDGRSDGAFRR